MAQAVTGGLLQANLQAFQQPGKAELLKVLRNASFISKSPCIGMHHRCTCDAH